MSNFSFIKEINPDNKSTWQKKLFLTFDIDWAHDEIINDTLNIISKYGIKSTWFATHNSNEISKLKENPNIEIGIHPNFNGLYNSDFSNGNTSIEVIKKYLKINPNSKSVRSHSLANSERLLNQFETAGLTHICNNFIPNSSGIKIKPFRLWDNIIIVTHCWQDNVSLKIDNKIPLNKSEETLLVYDFHPIHIFLNTECLERYERTRHLHQNPSELLKHRFSGFGVRNILFKLLELTKSL